MSNAVKNTKIILKLNSKNSNFQIGDMKTFQNICCGGCDYFLVRLRMTVSKCLGLRHSTSAESQLRGACDNASVILSTAHMHVVVIFRGVLMCPCCPCMVDLRRGRPGGVRVV